MSKSISSNKSPFIEKLKTHKLETGAGMVAAIGVALITIGLTTHLGGLVAFGAGGGGLTVWGGLSKRGFDKAGKIEEAKSLLDQGYQEVEVGEKKVYIHGLPSEIKLENIRTVEELLYQIDTGTLKLYFTGDIIVNDLERQPFTLRYKGGMSTEQIFWVASNKVPVYILKGGGKNEGKKVELKRVFSAGEFAPFFTSKKLDDLKKVEASLESVLKVLDLTAYEEVYTGPVTFRIGNDGPINLEYQSSKRVVVEQEYEVAGSDKPPIFFENLPKNVMEEIVIWPEYDIMTIENQLNLACIKLGITAEISFRIGEEGEKIKLHYSNGRRVEK